MKKAHFIGISGAGMSAVAKLLKDQKWDISGSDEGFYPPVSTYLEKQKIPLTKGYSKENIPKNVDLIVIGKNAKLIPETNEEVKFAVESGKPIKSFPELLGEITEKKKNIVVSGSYGKSTCTALLSWVLLNANKKPGYFIGAIPINMDSASEIGKGDIFVLEGDEYPTSNTDSTAKFLYMNPRDLLLTSAEHDHINIFPTIEDYLIPYSKLIDLMPQEGLVVYCSDNPNTNVLSKKHKNNISYGLDKSKNPTWIAQNIKLGQESTFNLLRDGKFIIELQTSLLGKHDIQNITGVAALLLEKELVTPLELQDGVKKFKGLKRRLDLKTNKSKVLVYEGFGSSYDKARSSFRAIKAHFPERRLITVFEPHTFSWRNRGKIEWYDNVFKDSQKVFLYKPGDQGAETHEQLSHDEIFQRVQKSGVDIEQFFSKNDGLQKLENELKENDVVLLMTSGDLGGMIESVPKLVEKKYPL